MKILVIHGSMRKGKTYALTKEIMRHLAAKPDVEFTEISVADSRLPFCISCHACFKKGEEHCPNYSHFSDAYKTLLDCDGIILSGATYMWALNAAMKNFLDHLSFNFHRPSLFGKKGMVIATSAGNGEKAVAKYLKTVLGQWGVNGAIVVTRNAKQERLVSTLKQAAQVQKAAERFYEQLASGRAIAPTLRSIVVHNAFRAMSLSDFAEYERDTEFWQQDGYRNRAYPIKAGLKYIVGATMFSVAKFTAKILGRRVTRNPNSSQNL